MKPIFLSYENPLAKDILQGDRFTHYELQSVREYQAPDGFRFFDVITEERDMEPDHPYGCGPIMIGLYGRLEYGGVQHIADYKNLEDAQETLRRMGIIKQHQ